MLKEIEPLLAIPSRMTSLNPYFNGTCSKSRIGNGENGFGAVVLILILMEHAQRDYGNNTLVRWSFNVLILILMEHAQRDMTNCSLLS